MSGPHSTVRVSVAVNGAPTEHEVEARTLLVQYLREVVGLTGTNIGCDSTSCGACTVLLDGESVKSCTVLAAQADGRAVTTIEGLADGDTLHPMQAAFREHHGLQCGYCTPGMVMAAVSLAQEHGAGGGAFTDADVRKGLEGNLCRCTGYHNIVAAVLAGSAEMAGWPVIPAAFAYARADSVDDAIALLAEHGDDAKLLAGGHSLLPLMKLRLATPSVLVDVGRLGDLSYVRDAGDDDRDRRTHPSPRRRARRAGPRARADPERRRRRGRRSAGAPPRHARRIARPRRPRLRPARGGARAARQHRRAGRAAASG